MAESPCVSRLLLSHPIHPVCHRAACVGVALMCFLFAFPRRAPSCFRHQQVNRGQASSNDLTAAAGCAVMLEKRANN
ncbi:unnamed protein product [Dibothriocephalus latus]|uniref:Uncharacterized protein n=1 Tax=Dibothriocephalus latus TaxID=60516 RepID=A0A3P7ME26_DIBLA|nr:unnamed protein product [Dibothriocephalus latus]